jgi:hypothetical protein
MTRAIRQMERVGRAAEVGEEGSQWCSVTEHFGA